MKLLDTTVAIDDLRGEEAAVDLLKRLIGAEETILASALRAPRRGAGRRARALEEFPSALTWVHDEVVSRTAGLLARKHRATYSGIDDVDYLIAATALALDAELLTTNLRHFPMLPGLRPPY